MTAPGLLAQVAQPDSATAIRAEAAFVRGLTAELLGDTDRAIRYFGDALTLAGDTPGILLALSDAHANEGRSEEALFYAERAVAADPSNVPAARHLAGLHLRSGEQDLAADVFRALLLVYPDDPSLWLDLAETEERARDLPAALEAYRRLETITGATRLLLSRRLRLYGQMDRPDDALTTLEALAALDPAARDLQMRLGLAYLAGERFEEAAAVFSSLRDTDASNPDYAFRLAEAYEALGRTADADAVRTALTEGASEGDAEARTRYAAGLYARSASHPEAAEAARRVLETLIDEGVDTYETRVMLGDLLIRAGEPAAAAVHLDAALAQNPRDPQVWAQAVVAHLDSGDRDAALRASEDGLLLFPGHFPLVSAAAHAAADAGRNRLAQERFVDAADLLAEGSSSPFADVERSRLLTMAALMHARLDEDAAADRRYSEALEANPDNDLALNNYAYALAERGERLDEALGMARRAVDANPQSPSYLDTLGWVYFKMKRFDEAAATLRGAAEAAGPSVSATILEHLGDAEAARGDAAAARASYQRALGKSPGNARLQEKAGR